MKPPMTRRTFIETASAALAGLAWTEALGADRPGWPIGCLNRAWTRWSFDTALDSIAAAGFTLTGLATVHPGEAFTSSAATPDYLSGLKKRLAQRGLTANLTTLRFRPETPLAETIADVRKQLDNAARLGLKFALTTGVEKPEHYEDFYRLMADAATHAEKRAVQVVIKPHGGVCAASGEILRCLDKVGHANFKVWYDAGNIIYYTGRNEVAELNPIAQQVTGLCAKDCPGPKGEVMSRFGTGKVDFKQVFAKLKSVGFNGPIMVEGVKIGATAEETMASARANREFLQKALGSL
jgi:sugar phosphate isomerase/epimerase